ncbi:hypothetical protein L1077_24445 [Pseudoalteromonas luteoviolacea]|uniref:Uncharacterized protein n=1 Tax=Pseudoalteromonas luteoviolacea H33 TaxID=1365251 RepID=A0A161Y9L6_9GAMM|nr:hypothetical protein [Pseudoalteromonas luteoviolacea]KZN52964.1 hypothetical protein N476_09270 [Pseudoalteromonas luteoviolacea H33]KZN78119.1 hypothetical protein N477_10795 [Pseudoalteromonas luteoviolacea H33-S]MBQ4875746.1 hypothetical protein [Pseudoalteromonas luteoviolacea]MBQ4904781.1 hypothetical protein [Pseudoalteromonas luteoviolacea]MCF6442575.1 hypothetical protein [Pseudoalteromonas luteoviolacea]
MKLVISKKPLKRLLNEQALSNKLTPQIGGGYPHYPPTKVDVGCRWHTRQYAETCHNPK